MRGKPRSSGGRSAYVLLDNKSGLEGDPAGWSQRDLNTFVRDVVYVDVALTL